MLHTDGRQCDELLLAHDLGNLRLNATMSADRRVRDMGRLLRIRPGAANMARPGDRHTRSPSHNTDFWRAAVLLAQTLGRQRSSCWATIPGVHPAGATPTA